MDLQAAQRKGGLGTGDPGGGELGGHGQLHGQEHGRRAIPLVGQSDEVLTLQQGHPKLPGERCDPIPRVAASWDECLHTGEQTIDEAVEQRIAVADMPVDGCDSHAEVLGESSHREGIHAMALNDATGGAQDIIGGDRW